MTSQFYLLGVINGVGGVMKLMRANGDVQWYGTFSKLTVTAAYSEIVDTFHVVGCGWYMTDANTYSAAIYRLGNDGTFKWFYLLAPYTSNTTAINKCYGIVYNEATQRITTLIHSTSTYLSYGSNYDLSLVVFDKTGTLFNGQMITFKYDI